MALHMEDEVIIKSVEELFEMPAMRPVRVLQVPMSDVVHFRIHRPESIFQMVEERLKLRDPDHFKGYAQARLKMEKSMRDDSIEKKVEASCVGHAHWVPDRRILFSTELEVWMDVSYPSPWSLGLYQLGLEKDILLHILNEGPFNELFHRLLLQKNGFERLAEDPAPDTLRRLVIGDPHQCDPDVFHLKPDFPNQRPHALSAGIDLPQTIANGAFIKDREMMQARVQSTTERYLRDVGYRLIGPTILLLLQDLAGETGPIGFSGRGSGFMTTLTQSLRHPWPWLPIVKSSGSSVDLFSIFPDAKAKTSLLPDRNSSEEASTIPPRTCEPVHLLLGPLHAFFEASLKGPKAAHLQASASAFIQDFAQITRGLQLTIPIEGVMGQWRQQILSPSSDLTRVILAEKIIPGCEGSANPLRGRQMVKSGPWPTASYQHLGAMGKQYVQLTAPERVKAIQNWRTRLAKGQPVN